MFQIKITKRKLDRKLNKLSKRFRAPLPLMRAIAGDMADAVEENFEKEGRPKWQALNPKTIKMNRKKGKTGKMLQRTGALASSVNTRYTDNYATAGSNKNYAKFLQKGTKHMPARSFLKLTGGDIRGITHRIGRYFSGK